MQKQHEILLQCLPWNFVWSSWCSGSDTDRICWQSFEKQTRTTFGGAGANSGRSPANLIDLWLKFSGIAGGIRNREWLVLLCWLLVCESEGYANRDAYSNWPRASRRHRLWLVPKSCPWQLLVTCSFLLWPKGTRVLKIVQVHVTWKMSPCVYAILAQRLLVS